MAMNMELEAARKRAVDLGNTGKNHDWEELTVLLKSGYPAVRRAAASGLGKMIDRSPDLARLLTPNLSMALKDEPAPQVLQYILKTLLKCAPFLNTLALDDLGDIVRDPARADYVRDAANRVIAAAEASRKSRESLLKHWCSRCKKIITVEESEAGLDKYGKPYCWHCLHEKQLEDANFNATVEDAKRLRTVNEVAVQSQGERRIGDWLEKKGIAYSYDERYMIARDTRIRPDFYLPEFDLYIEYWGMDTPEYVQNMQMKRILYQRAAKKLVSIGWRELDRIEQVLEEKLSRYIRLSPSPRPRKTS